MLECSCVALANSGFGLKRKKQWPVGGKPREQDFGCELVCGLRVGCAVRAIGAHVERAQEGKV